MRFIAALILSLGLSTPLAAQDAEETAFVTAMMESMNRLSVTFNREVCGYILRRADGGYESSKASWGGHASCASTPVADGQVAIASWHTHAAYAAEYDNEVPSIQDVEGDMRQGINGWVSTPGGRLWFVDGQTGFIRQACGRGCLPVGPNAQDAPHDPVPPSMSLDQLYMRFGRSR